MLFIVISRPDFFPGEADAIRILFDEGIDLFHLRKPQSSLNDCAALLRALPESMRHRIVTHEHFDICRDYALHGMHLNKRNPRAPTTLTSSTSLPPGGLQTSAHHHRLPAEVRPMTLSASCHSLAEVRERKGRCDYVFLSPVFDSISKSGYRAAFSPDELRAAARDGTIDDNVIALGGCSLQNIRALGELHFGGAAFLGDVWNRWGTEKFAPHAAALRRELGRRLP